MKASQHFAIGTKIKIAGKPPALILDKHEGLGLMVVLFDDGKYEIIQPFVMNRRTK